MVALAKNVSAADELWGYEFGVDGLMTADEVMTHLSVSRPTLNRLTKNVVEKLGRAQLRVGRIGHGERRFCKRSVVDYVRSLEV